MGKETNTATVLSGNSFLTDFIDGLSPEDKAALAALRESGTTTKKPPKSGLFTRTQVSSNVPNDLAITENINKAYQKYYGRDANPQELAIELPKAKALYKNEKGQTKSTIKETYKNGLLVKTEYLTADGSDPILKLEDKVKNQLATGKVAVNQLNIPEGPAGKYFVNIKDLARNNGINLSDTAAKTYATQIAAGIVDENTVINTLRESAASAFPLYADQIKAGLNLNTLANPYIQSMSNILEIPDGAIDLFDPTVRGALSYTMPDGKLGTKSLYEFEKDLRRDPRWQFTDNAKASVSGSVQRVLQDFGFMG
jgi:hypothetical protein